MASTKLLQFALPRVRINGSIWIRGLSTSPPKRGPNRIYQPIRSVSELDDLLLLTSSNQTPLLTFWTASWCPSCRTLLPTVQSFIEDERFGEGAGGVSFVEVEYDAPDTVELGIRYIVTSIPTMLSFSRGEAQIETKLTRVEQMKDKEFMKAWIEKEAKRGGSGGAGGSGFFSGLFGKG